MIPQKQLTLADIFEDCKDIYESDKPQFLTLLENHIDLDEIIPVSFRNHYYASTGRNRKYPLNAMLWALIIQRLFSIPTDSLLLVFLHYSRHLREFCGFTKVPDASKITRFKQDFLPDLQSVFDNLVDITEPICHDIDENLASMLLFDTSGIEAYVTENNPKYANRIIRQLKTYAKANNFDDSYDPYKAAYASMPTSAAANHEVKQQNINGHFCYAYKFGILTNGLGIVRSIDFYNRDYLDSHPDIVVEKKSKSPDEDKSLADSKALLPTLKDFKKRHSDINPGIFLGDSAFDTMDNTDYIVNENGIPCCPHNSSLPMKREGSKSHLKSKLPTMKFVCPKMKWEYNREDKSKRRVCHCDNPCTTSSCGRMIYIYPEKNLRAYPGVERGSQEWEDTYKIRVNVEKSINHFKDSFCVANRKTTNEKTLHADLLLAGISQLLTVVVADKINQWQHIRSLKSFIA